MAKNEVNNENKKTYLIQYYCRKYIKIVADFETHVIRLAQDWIIDDKDKNNYLKTLDMIIKHITLVYNSTNANSIILFDKIKNNLLYNIDKISFTPSNEIFLIYFNDVHKKLVEFGINNGIININSFFNLFLGKSMYDLFPDNELLCQLYNEIFIPVTIAISEHNYNDDIVIKKIDLNIDGIMDCDCEISFWIETIKRTITFKGYIAVSALNTYSKSIQCFSSYVNDVKTSAKIIVLDKYPNMCVFYENYIKIMGRYCFIYNAEQLADKIISILLI